MRVLERHHRRPLGDLRLDLLCTASDALGKRRGQTRRVVHGPAQGLPGAGGISPLDQGLGQTGGELRFQLGLGCVANDVEIMFQRGVQPALPHPVANPRHDGAHDFARPPLLAGEFPERQRHVVVIGLIVPRIGQGAPSGFELLLGLGPGRNRQSRMFRHPRTRAATRQAPLPAQPAHGQDRQATHREAGPVRPKRQPLRAVWPDPANDHVLGEKPEQEEQPAGQNETAAGAAQPIGHAQRTQQATGTRQGDTAIRSQIGVSQGGEKKRRKT